MCVCVYVCMYVRICLSVCARAYVCVKERERERERKVGRSSPENGAIKADIGGSAIDINTIKYLSFAGDLDGWVGQSVGRSVGRLVAVSRTSNYRKWRIMHLK